MSGSTIAPLFQIGPRIAGKVLGSPFAHYRANGPADPTGAAQQIGTINAWVTTDPGGKGTRPPTHGKSQWHAMLDTALTQPGDYLVGDWGTFFIASQYGLHPTQVIQCNKTVTISRPGADATGDDYYGGTVSGTLTPLLTAWPASVLQGTKGEKGEVQLPGDTRLSWVAVLLPATGGAQIMPGDWIVTDDAQPMTYTASSAELTALGWRLTAATAVP